MKLLTRYTIREFLVVFLLTLAGMTAFFLLVGVGREAVREGLGLGPILRILPFIIPDSMRFSIPAAALLATCAVYGRMSSDNEVVAIKSVGISPWTMMIPVFILGILISGFAVWINDLAVSWGRLGMSRVVTESIEPIVYGMLRTQRSFSNDRFSINVRDVQGRRLILPILSMRSDKDGGTLTVAAREAELVRNPTERSLSILLTDGEAEGPNIEANWPGTREYVIQTGSMLNRKDLSPSDFALRTIPAERAEQQQEIRRLEYGLAAHAAFQMMSGELRSLGSQDWVEHQQSLRMERYRLNRLRTEPWRRWANGFSCFFFVFVGAPWAIQKRNSDFVSIFFMVFLPILLIYYPLMAYGVDRAKAGALPQYAVWLGNLACALVAARLLNRILRH